MNVYITQTATQLAALGTEVEVFTRATSSDIPPRVEVAPGVTVRSVVAGPFETLDKSELPAQLCSFAAGALGVEARQAEGHYDVVHSHYWLSGQIGGLARRRWRVPLVHTAHTLAKVKNAALAEGDSPEPPIRVRGEERVITDADRLIANTETEAGELIDRYGAHPDLVDTVLPGVDLERFRPGERSAARAALGVSQQARVIAFVGRIQPLKAPDVLLHAVAELLSRSPEQRAELLVLVVGGPSGNGLDHPDSLHELAAKLGISDVVRFVPPQRGAALSQVYRAADVVAVPSYNESFGLVALEAQACGTPVVAAAVGGLPIAVADGVSGRLVPGHGSHQWADALAEVVLDDAQRRRLSVGATAHAARFSWERTTRALLDTYAQAKMAYHQSSAREVTA